MAIVSAHSDCCFFAPCTNILTYLLTYLLYRGAVPGAVINDKSQCTVSRRLRYCAWHFQWQFTANSLLNLLMQEF